MLEGRLSGDWVREMERCWIEVAARLASPRIRIDLIDVSFIDEAGRELLAQMAAVGAQISAADLHTRAIIEEIVGSVSPHESAK